MKKIPELRFRLFIPFVILLCISSLVGCDALSPFPTPPITSTATNTATKTPTKTATKTRIPTTTLTHTPESPPTATLQLVPTSSINDQSALSLSAECRKVIDGLYTLKKDKDFNPNQYFQVLSNLRIKAGYTLDYISFSDELGGMPLVYARKSNAVPFQTYEEFLGSYGEEMSDEASYAQLNHAFDYLEQIQVDNSPESYFQFVVLAILGDQFSLSWHGLYNDVKILCDSSDMTYVNEDMKDYSLVFPQGMTDRIEQVDFEPVIIVDENTVTVRFVTFTKWGGFFEFVYVMDKQNPMQLIDAKYNPLIEYDCGIMF